MIFGLRFGKLGRNSSIKSSIIIDSTFISVKDEKNNPVSNVKVEIYKDLSAVSISYTNNDGLAKVTGNYGDTYKVVISGNNILTETIENWVFSVDVLEVSVKEKPYLNIKPEYIFLCPGNNYIEDVSIFSNINWVLT